MEKDLQDFMTQYPDFENCTIETFDDNKARSDIGLHKRLSTIDFDVLNKLNQRWSAVFFSVNPMEKGERKQESVTKIVTWVCEIDNMSKENQWKLIEKSPLPPSCIIESKNSLHLYRFSKDGTIDNRVKIGTGLMKFFSWDPKVCKDYGWLLRLPWFMHMKDPDDPFLVKLISIDANIKYTEKEMLDAFPVVDAVVEVKQYEWSYASQYDWIRGEISKWDNEQMLRELSGKNIINGEAISFKKNPNGTKQIVVNGKPSGAWIDTKGMIWSHSKGGPTRIQFVLWYKTINRSQLLRYIKDNYSYKLSPEYVKKIEKETYLVKGKMIPVDFAMYLKESESFAWIDGNIFKYFSDEWLWRHLNDNKVSQFIISEAKDFLELSISEQELRGTLKFLKAHAESDLIKEQLQKVNDKEINLQDGILDTNSRSVRPYTKEDYKFSKLPYNSVDIKDYETHKPKRFLQFMSEVFASYENPDEVISYIQELVWYFLLPTTKMGRIHILKWGGRNWKWKFIGAVVNMLGQNNCCTINLSKLEDVDLEKLLGRLLAVDADTSDNIRLDQGVLRKITEWELIEWRKRYWHPFEFKPFARIVLSANIDPTIKFCDENMIRRIIYIPFRENFKKIADPELWEKLNNEALGLFIRSLHGLKKLLERGSFIIPEEIARETEKYLKRFASVKPEDPVDGFIQYMWLVPWNDLLPKSDIFWYYIRYCQLQGKKRLLGIQQLTRILWNKWFSDKDDSSRRGMGVNLSLLDMTFWDKTILEKSYEDSG